MERGNPASAPPASHLTIRSRPNRLLGIHPIRQLGFTIPPGQFAFLLSEEKVEIPNTASGLISIKAKIKWRGLINVSGFHVDPGFRGRLIFSVYNAGPVPVHLRQGQPMFLIWYTPLDAPPKLGHRQPVQESFPPDLISGISGARRELAKLDLIGQL